MDEQAIARANQIADLIGRHVHKYVRPVCLGTNAFNAHSVFDNGSWFALRIDEMPFGITAAHVVHGVRAAHHEHPHLDVMLGSECRLPLWDPARIIAISDELDIATFRINDDELKLSGIEVWPTRGQDWPPALPPVGAKIMVTGFPGIKRTVLGAKSLGLEQITNALIVDSVSDTAMTALMEPGNLFDINGKRVESVDIRWGGYSGGAVWHVTDGSLWVMRPAGLVIEATVMHDTVLLRIARIDKIRPDGQLAH